MGASQSLASNVAQQELKMWEQKVPKASQSSAPERFRQSRRWQALACEGPQMS